MKHSCRDYQEEDVAAILNEFKDASSTLYVAATGLGKTFVMCEVVERMGVRAILLAHRSELVFQARNAFLRRGIEPEIEKAELTASTSLFNRAPVVLATVQTLSSGKTDVKRVRRFNPMDFGLLLYDECFPAGTVVDGKPIETIKVGDFVTTGSIMQHKVLKTFKNKPKSLVRLYLSDGTRLTCTGNHPIWDCSLGCFVPASMLASDSVALRLTIHDNAMQDMRSGVSLRWEKNSEVVRKPELQKDAIVNNDGGNKQEIRIRKDEEKEPDARPRLQGKDVRNIAGNRAQASRKGRKRKATNGAGAENGNGSGLGNWCPYTYRMLERCEWDAPALHNRRGKQGDEGGDRNRWVEPSRPPRAGQKERLVLRRVGVDGVEILEQGSDGTFGGLCPDGYVYNLHVETDNTYWADGILVHNCHHSVSEGNKKIVDYFTNGNPNLKVLGVTATPDRADEQALGQIFESVAAERDVLFGVDNGWLINPQQMMISVSGLDFSHMRTTAGDLNGADLAAAMEAEESIQGVVQPVLEAMFECNTGFLHDIEHGLWGASLCALRDPRRTIVFTVSVRQAEMLSNIFNRVIPNISSWVCGKTPEQERMDIFRSFESGRTSILVNCGVTTEGYDNPEVSIIAIARPTKSRSLYAQMVGRGTRPLAGVVDGKATPEERLAAIAVSAKPTLLVMDFVGNSGKHKLITTADILGGKFSDEVVALAETKAKLSKTPVDMRKLLEEEEKKLAEERERRRLEDEAKKQKLVARVKYSKTSINPFDVFDMTPVKTRGWDEHKTLSEKQRHMLMRQGIDPDSMSYSEGRAILNEFFRRWNGNLCTIKQANLLKKHYPELDVRNLTMKQAGGMIDMLAKNGWKRK